MRPLLIITVACLIALGFVVIYSASSAEVIDLELQRSGYQALMKQMLYSICGVLFGYTIYLLGYRRFFSLTPLLFIVFTLLLLFVLLPYTGRAVNGSRRWLNIPGLSVQPSEMMKYLLPLFFIHRLASLPQGVDSFWRFVRYLLPFSIPLLLILVEPNNGTVAVIVITLVVVWFIEAIPLKYWALPLAACALIGGTFASQLPYVRGRVQVYLNPELDLLGRGHQPHQAKVAAGSGLMLGKGPGNSWQKLSFLPEAQNDYIAAIYAEEFGFLGVLLLISLYMTFTLIGFNIALKCTNPLGTSLAVVCTFLVAFQAFLNLGVVSGILPSTGLNLPFFSQGGSSLLANLMGVSLLLSVNDDRREPS